ncbi:MAG TPA: PEP-CTERM sorting domain-containing protein [Verrucomicrobiae bacterium]|nr:PEP-CTERM sorting domain-containing protein [Verrucomicrobiae bacterium]
MKMAGKFIWTVAGLFAVGTLQAQTITFGSMPFTAGDLVLYQVGDGSTTLGTASAVVFLDEYSESGSLIGQMEMPTSAVGSQAALTAQGNSASEGLLTISPNEQYIAITGYGVAPGAASPSTTAADSRVVGILNVANGHLDTSTALTDESTTSSFRSAITTDGTKIWVTGGATGVRYTTLGSTTSLSLTNAGNNRQIAIYPTAANPGGQLMLSTASGGFRLANLGSGLPTTSGQVPSLVPGTTATSPSGPYAFVQLTLGSGSIPDTMYVADDGNSSVEKWSLVGGNWVMTGSEALTAPRGITAVETNGMVDVFVTAGSSSVISNIVEFTDASGLDGTFVSSTNIITQLPANEQFRGVVDLTLVPEPSTVMLVGMGLVGGLLALRRRRS